MKVEHIFRIKLYVFHTVALG